MARIIDGTPSASSATERASGRARALLSSVRTVGSAARLALVSGLLVAAAFGVPASAFSATAKAPDAGGAIDLQTWVESGQLIIVTAITVPASTPLPATVRIPVPQGATVQWAGEILGGELSADPARPYKIVKSPVGGQYAEFSLEQTRSAQVDADMTTVTVNGASVAAAFEWIQATASPSTSFSLRVPAGASDVKFTPGPLGEPDTNADGERLYSGTGFKLDPGQTQPVALSYTTGVPGPAASSSGSIDSLVFALVAALCVAIAVLAGRGRTPAQCSRLSTVRHSQPTRNQVARRRTRPEAFSGSGAR